MNQSTDIQMARTKMKYRYRDKSRQRSEMTMKAKEFPKFFSLLRDYRSREDKTWIEIIMLIIIGYRMCLEGTLNSRVDKEYPLGNTEESVSTDP